MEENNNKKSIRQYLSDFPYIQVLFVIGITVFIFLYPHDKNSTNKNILPEGWMTINPPGKVTTVIQWQNSVFAGDNKGVYKIELSTGKVLEKLKQDVQMEYVRALMIDNKDNLWVCHINGASKFDGKRWINFNVNNGLPDNRANCVLQDSKGLIWIGTSKGIGIYDGNAWKQMTVKDGLITDMVNVIAQHTNGTMFFGSYLTNDGGVSCLYKGKWQYFTAKNGLSHDYINCFYQDKSQGIWVGTGFLERGGACRFQFKDGEWVITKTLTYKDGLAGEKVCSIFEQKNGIMWFGSEYDGISFNKEGKWGVVDYKKGLAGCEVKSMLLDSYGTMWFATPDGISRVTSKALEKAIVFN